MMIHMAMNNYYPNITTQIISSCVLYIILFFVFWDMISMNTMEQYKYYYLMMIFTDLIFFIYLQRKRETNIDTKIEIKTDAKIKSEKSEKSETENDISEFYSMSDIDDNISISEKT